MQLVGNKGRHVRLFRDGTSILDKVVLVLADIYFLLVWILFCLHLIRGWSTMDPRLHPDMLTLTLAFGALWITLLRERNSILSMLLALTLLPVYHLAFR